MQITDHKDTIVAISTAPGVGAIAVIRLSGEEAIKITDEIFIGKKLAEVSSHTLHFGVIEKNGTKVDEVVVGIFKNPKSYTGEDIIEISCHGSPFIQQQILQLIISKGARLAKPGEFTMRAFLNGKMDLSQAEAVADLINAQTLAAHDIALKQMRGGYSEELKKLRYELIHFASMIELELDFSEEDVEFAERRHMQLLIEKINVILNGLIKSFELGNVIKNGINTVIAGRPNAGKSTLLNALLNEERAIVSEIAGTTRDTIEEELNINGIIFRLIDTAGIREAKDEIEKMGVAKTMEKIASSTLLIYVFDVNNMSLEDVKNDLASLISSGDKMLLVANKIDTPEGGKLLANFFELEPDAYISSLQKTNIEELKSSMYKKIVTEDLNIGNIIVTNARHLEALQKTRSSLDEVLNAINSEISGELTALHIRYALNALGEITGEITNDDLLDDIFRNFCIGK
ncbi:MAG: tRNA uridine-5-carboxymethylaminomethyl(34) synthesis GTPase MnmE [Bacteroidetes bacterium]|nr:tRNA uridine-5-carboxymethylaminomethyl(34) synthesis GTPase MnmE [Bacteroidota bacterium]